MTLRLLAVALVAAGVLQQPSQSQTTIRSGVDLLRLHVTALDADGQPVRDLGPGDFIVEVDGRPRAVSFARFYGPAPARAAAPSASPAPAPVSFASNVGGAPGRIVLLVVDVESMRPGYEKLVLETAGAMIDRLAPEDSVGLLVLPGGGVEMTREHRRVRDALAGLRGFASANPFQEHVISVSEAEGFERGDVRVKQEVIERECPAPPTSAASAAPSRMMACPSQLEQEARQVLMDADRRIRSVLATLTGLNARLKSFEAPKTLVLLSAGLPFRVESMGRFRDLQRESAEAGTTTYIIQLDQPQTDAGSPTSYGASAVKRDLHEGLSTIAQVTEGTLSAGVGPARGVFERLYTEFAHTYQLGVESLPSDGDGKPHTVEVKARRPGVTIRARREVIRPEKSQPALTPLEVLEQPTDRTDAPVAAAAYTTRGDDSTTLKVIIVVELLSAAPGSAAPSYAFTVLQDDKPIFKTADDMTSGPAGARAVVGAQLAPGDYRLRVAAVDAAGRAGSVDMPLKVALRQSGALQFSHLLAGTVAGEFEPATHFSQGTDATAFIELYTADLAQFEGVTVDLEVRRAGQDEVIGRAPAVIHSTPQARRRIAEGIVSTASLAPGTYVISAVVRRPGETGGRISTTIVVRTP